MRKQIAIFSVFILFSSLSSAQIGQIGSYKAENKITEFKTDGKSVFLAQKYTIKKISPDSNWTTATSELVERHLELGKDLVLTGSQRYGDSLILLNKDNGEIVQTENIGNWVNSIGIHEKDNQTVFLGSSHRFVKIYNTDGESVGEYNGGFFVHSVRQSADVDGDKEPELLVGGRPGHGDGARFQLVNLDGVAEWRTDWKDTGITAGFVPEEGIIIRWGRKVSLRSSDGDLRWKRTAKVESNIVNLSSSFVHYKDSYLVWRNYKDGSITNKVKVSEPIAKLKRHPSQDLLIAKQRNNLSIFSLEGEKLGSRNIHGLNDIFRFTDFNSDGEKEIAVASGDEVIFLDIRSFRENTSINHSLSETVFVGNSRELLKAVALGRPVFVADSYSEVEEEVEETGLEPVSVNVDGPDRVDDINEAFNLTRERYYAGSREKAVYVAALAAEENASLTFDGEKADRDFSNHTVEELQELFIQEFRPNHLVVADLDSDKGVLAAYMAARQGSLAVDYSQETDYTGIGEKDAEEMNDDNGVISLDQRIEQTFERIGENRNTVFEGKYVSLLDAPRKVYEDPVEKGFFDDPADGEYYTSDLQYGNLDSDSLIEAGVGRYPGDVSDASVLFHRSMNRESEKEAVVASEYLHSKWPVILSTFGGGMRYGKAVETSVEQEGFDTTHLVEHRSDPVGLMMSLSPASISGFLDDTETLEARLQRVISDNAAHSIKNAIVAVKALKYAEGVLEMYYEFQWHSYDFSLDRAKDRVDQLEIPEGTSSGSVVQKGVMEAIYVLFWPERQPRLTEESLVGEMGESDIIYYSGVGNSTSWVMPNNDSSYLKNRYTGENRVEPEEVPELDSPIVWDNSNNAGTMDGKMKDEFLENGASSFLGFSTVNYGAYSAVVANNFFRYGDTLGESEIQGVNSLRNADLIYSPASSYRAGVREKMSSSLRMYGNPEMEKDPLESRHFTVSKECADHRCEIEASLDPEYNVTELGDRKVVEFEADSYLLEPGAPITPLYSFNRRLPAHAEVTDIETSSEFRAMEDVYLPETDLLSHGNRFINSSRSYEVFPETLSNTSRETGKVRFVQAALQKHRNTTRVLEEAEVRIEYTTPVTVDLEKSGENAVAYVNSRKDIDARMIYSINRNRSFRRVKINEGENRFRLGKLAKGNNSLEVYIADGDIIAQESEKLLLAERPEIQVFAPDIHRGDVRRIRAVVENPNNFSINQEISIDTGEKVQLGMLESDIREIRLSPGETRTISWRFTGIKQGNSSVEIRNSSSSLGINAGRSSQRFTGIDRVSEVVGSPYRETGFSREDSSLDLTLETDLGSVRYTKTPEYEYRSIRTDSFSASVNRSEERIIRKVSTREGTYVKKISNGIATESGNLSPERAAELIEKLERESRKLYSFYRLSQGGE